MHITEASQCALTHPVMSRFYKPRRESHLWARNKTKGHGLCYESFSPDKHATLFPLLSKSQVVFLKQLLIVSACYEAL